MRDKIIIDTDIGDDIDDALAIQMALHSPELDVVGITTVFKSCPKRARLAAHLLYMNGRSDIPVALGAAAPLTGNWDSYKEPCQYSEAAMGHYDCGAMPEAASFLVEQTALHPQQIRVAAIGALTNIASAIRLSDDFARNVKEIVLMGGVYSYHYNEWNIKCDPEAAAIVFQSGIPIVMVGLDVTLSCYVTADEALDQLDRASYKAAPFIGDCIRMWRAVSPNRPIYLHDPLVIAAMIDPTTVKTEQMLIRVETKGQYTQGMTFAAQRPFGERQEGPMNAAVCTDVDKERVVRLFAERTLQDGAPAPAMS
ncbi:nucleoside hydrolase [Paenibacillus hodogayensis]|uniref:Nucleoside hydrolase n=1 Tax=Paenibacillus hodogayensis TaxID=279208 RepID=A0ABV5W6Q2_9BACL